MRRTDVEERDVDWRHDKRVHRQFTDRHRPAVAGEHAVQVFVPVGGTRVCTCGGNTGLYMWREYGSVSVAGIRGSTCIGNTGQYLWRWEYGSVPVAAIRVSTCGGNTDLYLRREYGSVPVAGIRVNACDEYTGLYL